MPPFPPVARAVSRLARVAVVLLALLIPVASAVAPATPAVTVSASPSPVTPGNTVNLVAAMPVADSGTISQEIVLQIDPAKVKLTSAKDITAPAGWTVSYCSTTCTAPPANFSATVPANAAAWAAVKAVRAAGSVDSQGEYQGRQLAARTSTIAIPASGPFASSGSGDGWNVFFDDRGYVFNIFHHNSANSDNVDCRDRNGVTCGSNWPYGSGTGNGQTSYVSNGWYDPVHKHLWYDATRSYEVGFECVDVSDIADPQPCGGNAGSTFVAAGISKSPIAGTPNFGIFASWQTRGIAQIGGRIFSQSDGGTTPKVTCVDTQANGGLGAKCPGSPFDPTPGQASDYIGAVMASGGKLWVTSSNTSPRGGVTCFEPTTLRFCSGTWPQTWSMGAAGQLYHLFEIPTAGGGNGGICVTSAKCFSTSGASVTLNAGLASWYDGVGDAFGYSEHALRQGSRLYRGNGNGAAAGAGTKTFSCWDQSLSSGAGGVCPNWPIAVTNYGIALDPLNDNCVWKNDHQNSIKAYDAITATQNCTTPPSRVVIPAETAVPRMACATPGSGVREWRSIKLLAPAASGYTSATLTIRDSTGADIPGWVGVPFNPASSRRIDLASLSVSATGQSPTFIVEYVGLTSATNTSVEVVAVGDSPELCLTPEAVSTCPVVTGPGSQPDSPANGSFAVLGDGSATTGGGTTPYAQGTASVVIGAGPSPACASTLSGTALSNDANTLPIAGATVALLDSSGTALTYPSGHPQAGQAMTATTDVNGDYAFPLLAAGTYKVKFVSTATDTIQSSRMIASSAGPGTWSDYANASGTGGARTAISPATSITASGPGVVNGYFNAAATAPSRSDVAPLNTAIVFNPFASAGSSPAATPSSGSSFVAANKAATRLCDPTTTPPQNGTTVACTLASRVVAGQGTWTVNTNSGSADVGKITFTPENGYTGTATAISYGVTDAAGQKAAGTLTPSVVGAPSASADTSTGAWDANQTITPLTNDSAGSGASLVPSTVRLCTTGTATASCSGSTLTISNEGTYTANNDGTVTFDPLPTFSGPATAIKYVVQDSAGQTATSTITPSVGVPSPPVATPEAKAVIPGGTATFTNLITGGSALATGAALQTGNTNGPCLVDPSDSVCKATFAIAGEGTWTVDRTTGVATFAALGGATAGVKTAVTYRVTDVAGQTASSTLTPTVVGAPSATSDTSTGAWDANQTITVLANDAAASGASLVANTVRLCPNPQPAAPYTAANCNLSTLTISGEGTYTANANGTVTFDPVPAFSGQVPTPVRYVVQDNLTQLASALITPTVNPPAMPVATPETKSVIPGGTATFSNLVTGAGALATGSGLQTGNTNGPCLVDPSDSVCKATFSIAGEGTWTVNRTTGVATFVALNNATAGTKTPVTYRVTDAVGQTATSTLTPTIPAPPAASPDTSVGAVDINQTIRALLNDTAGSGTSLVPSTVRICATATATGSCTGTTLTNADGTYTANADGTVTFDPLPSFTGTATPIKYVVDDALGQRTTSVITPQVVSIPAPVASPDTSTGLPGATQMVNPVLNDTPGAVAYPLDPTTVRLCGPSETAPACTQTSRTTSDGVFSVNPLTGAISFQPVAGFLGTAAPVTYMVSDTALQRTSTTYTPSVVGVGPPQVSPSAVSVAYGTPGTMTPQVTPGTAPLDPARSCLAASGATCTAGQTSLTRPEGTYVLDPSTGVVTFTPAQGYSGTPSDPPRFCATDTLGQSACATLTPTVAPPPADATAQGDPGRPLPGAPSPAALPDVESTMAGQAVTLRPLANDSPSSGAMLNPASVQLRDPKTGRYQSVVTVPGQGTFRVNPDGSITFTPQAGFVGTTPAITYRVSDSLGKTTTSTVTVIVRDTPPPWADPQFDQAMRGQTVIFDPVGQASPGSAPLVPGSVRIKDPETGKWTTRVVVPGQGTWTVDTSTGKVRFTPLSSFVGSATPLEYRVADRRGQRVRSSLNAVIRAKGPALEITTRASRPVLRPGQTSLITLRIANQGLATTRSTVTRAPIPKGFAVVNPMGGTVRGGWIRFATGNLKSGGSTTRRFVLVATAAGAGQGDQQLTGWATSTNTRSVNDPTALRVIGAVTGKAAVTG